MRSRVLGICLENLWHFTRGYIERGSSTPLPSYVLVAFAHQKLTRRLRKGGNIASRVIGSCVGALVVSKLATAPNLVNDAELECLSAILGIQGADVKLLLNHPGAVQFASMIFLVSDDIYDAFWNPTSDVLDIIQQTFSILSQALPTQLDASMQLDLTDSLMDVSKGWFQLILWSCAYGLKLHVRDLVPLPCDAQQSFRHFPEKIVAFHKRIH